MFNTHFNIFLKISFYHPLSIILNLGLQKANTQVLASRLKTKSLLIEI